MMSTITLENCSNGFSAPPGVKGAEGVPKGPLTVAELGIASSSWNSSLTKIMLNDRFSS